MTPLLERVAAMLGGKDAAHEFARLILAEITAEHVRRVERVPMYAANPGDGVTERDLFAYRKNVLDALRRP